MRERGRYCSRQIELRVHTSFPCPQGPMGMTSGSRENAFLRVTLVLGQEFRTWENPILHRGCWKMCTAFSGERCYFYYPGQGKKKFPLCSRGRYTISFVLHRHFWKASPREKKKKSCHTTYSDTISWRIVPWKNQHRREWTFFWIPRIYKSNSLALYTPNDSKPSYL